MRTALNVMIARVISSALLFFVCSSGRAAELFPETKAMPKVVYQKKDGSRYFGKLVNGYVLLIKKKDRNRGEAPSVNLAETEDYSLCEHLDASLLLEEMDRLTKAFFRVYRECPILGTDVVISSLPHFFAIKKFYNDYSFWDRKSRQDNLRNIWTMAMDSMDFNLGYDMNGLSPGDVPWFVQ